MAKLALTPHIGLPLLIAGALVATPAHLPAQTPAPAGPQEAGVVGLFLDSASLQPTVVLQGKRDRRTFAMAIGAAEATGIVYPLENRVPPRPLTHDLVLTLFGRLKVAGFAVASAYFKGDGGDILDHDGFFDTGDVATIDQYGYMRITDRSKDVIKSGGEWISSIDLENLAVGHPAVAEAAVIGVHHPKWDERPLLIVQLKQGQNASREDILKYMDGKIAKWWMPDDIVFVDGIPHTATGKILKTALRDQFKAYRFPNAAA